MATASEKLVALRRQLAERFPSAPRAPGRVLGTGIPALDEASGGIPLSAVTEIVCSAPSCGSQLLLGQLLAVTRASRARVALIDSNDSFDPASFPADLLAHLVWVRCRGSATALQAADLLTRDANLGFVFLDLRRAPEAELRRTPPTFWYRLQRAVEPTDLALVVLTPRVFVASAQLRLLLAQSHPFAALASERPTLKAQLAPSLQRQRIQSASAG